MKLGIRFAMELSIPVPCFTIEQSSGRYRDRDKWVEIIVVFARTREHLFWWIKINYNVAQLRLEHILKTANYLRYIDV